MNSIWMMTLIFSIVIFLLALVCLYMQCRQNNNGKQDLHHKGAGK